MRMGRLLVLCAGAALCAETDVGAISVLSRKGLQAGVFTQEYVDAVIARESRFPTGLLCPGDVGIAIPHEKPVGKNQSEAILVGRFNGPVQFGVMASDGSVKVDVKIGVLLSISQDQQARFLGDLFSILTKEANTKRLVSVAEERFADVVQETFGSLT